MNKICMPLRPIAATALALGLASCSPEHGSGADAQESALKDLDILIDWQAEPTYLGVYYAVEMGFLEDEGYAASVTESWGANQAVAAVASGQNILGTASGGATVLGRNNDANVLSTAVIYPRIPTVIYGLEATKVSEPGDLIGKRIGIYPSSITKNEFDAFVDLNGLDKSQIEILSLNGADIPLLVSGQVDGVLHYTEMSPSQVETSSELEGAPGSRTFQIPLSEFGVGGYGLNIIANPDAYSEDPEGIKAATDAITKGYVEGCENKDAAVAVFLRLFPDKDEAYVRFSWDRVCEMLGPNPGSQTADRWNETIELYQSLDLLTAQVSAAEIMGQ